MDSNLSLTLGFKGQLKLNAQAVPLQEGYLKLGGIVDDSQTNGLKFGVVVSAATTDIDAFKAGVSGTDVIRGVCVFDDSIAQNAPAHPDRYLAGLPCAALNHGFMYLADWGKTATGAADPVIGGKVIYKTATGEIEFMAASGTVPSDWAELPNASIRDVDATNGALIYLN